MDKTHVVISKETCPYTNLATEYMLLGALEPDEQLLFLWQNSNTIVIGRNQNAGRECQLEAFEQSGGRLARRLSGGGAVYHDSGNLNFSFISPRSTYDMSRNRAIMCAAVQSFGLAAEYSGRNDLEIAGAKFSGNAFYANKQARCHHGTLMVAVDTQKLSTYLKPDPQKLAQRGVASVQARVVNLGSLCDTLTVDALSSALIGEFSRCYSCEPQIDELNKRLNPSLLAQAKERFALAEWRLGKQQSFDHQFDQRYVWGGIELRFVVRDGRIQQVQVYSDALDADFIDVLSYILEGTVYTSAALAQRFAALGQIRPEYHTMLNELITDVTQMLVHKGAKSKTKVSIDA